MDLVAACDTDATKDLLLQVVRDCKCSLHVFSVFKIRLNTYCTCFIIWDHLIYNSVIFLLLSNRLGDHFYLSGIRKWDVLKQASFQIENYIYIFFLSLGKIYNYLYALNVTTCLLKLRMFHCGFIFPFWLLFVLIWGCGYGKKGLWRKTDSRLCNYTRW